ncbi:hypothetical protein ACIQ1D_00375 [Lysinibacillus xylanilyticus]|uniref:hypothetical protein n=1 Tax=Lysinibacillus xylanilyticus TaxID=582475 RepID=UPI0038003F1D
MNKRWNRKKWLLISGSILTTTIIGIALFSLLFYYTKPIPYSADLFKIEETADGTLIFNYLGESHAGSHMTHPLEIEIDGEVKNISFIYYVESIANSPTRDNLIKSDGKVFKASDQFTLPYSQYTDAI